MTPTLQLAIDLIRRPSLTPEDAGCQEVIGERLKRVGFKLEHLSFAEVNNLWATHGEGRPLFCFLGHTDVVPPGALASWRFDPFQPTVESGLLYGRGAADMKGGLAAMVTAAERFLGIRPGHAGTIAFLITSDEEGPAINGTAAVAQRLQHSGVTIDWCLVGEPSGNIQLGDVIKNGRRGTLTGTLRIIGTQGHVAYPERANNPIHRALSALAALCEEKWDEGSAPFPPTSFQISNMHAGTGADNVIPAELEVVFNFRYSPALTTDLLKSKLTQILKCHSFDFELDWRHSGQPFLTKAGPVLDAVTKAIHDITGRTTTPSTVGGTSDGRFIALMGAEVVELGPINATIHKVDEHVAVEDLDTLSAIYERVLCRLFGPP
ncbi:MAG: succinyl-diaminopimelate desuccinylase [Gammaproteobacteria bacterium]